MKKESAFVAASPIEKCIHAGDPDGVIALLRTMPFKDRHALHTRLKVIQDRINQARWESDGKIKAWWGGEPSSAQLAAGSAAMFFCGGSKARVESWDWSDRLYPYLDMLEPAALQGFAADLVSERPSYMSTVQRLVLDGLSDRPDSDQYIIGLIGTPRRARGGELPILRMMEADPGLLEVALPRIFDVEGDGDSSMAAIEKYAHGDNTWTYALLELISTGKLSRAYLIERCLHTLEKDWPQFRAGWFSRFHDKLAPSVEEMAPLVDRYLGLCHSRIPPTVALALSALAPLMKGARVDSMPLLDALAPVMTSAVKGHIDVALKLLDLVVKREPGRAHAAAALAQRALVHESPDLQKKVIARLGAWGFDDATRLELEAALPYVAALHRDSLAALCGAAPVRAAPQTASALVEKGLLSPLDASRLLAPINDMDELVQTIAFVFENEREIDDFERALEALARLGPELRQERERFSPVLKRSLKMFSDEHDVGRSLALALAAAFDGKFFAHAQERCTASDALLRRSVDLTVFMAQGSGLAPLSAATHKRGFIDPLVLAERIAAHAQAGATSSLEEQVRALLRMPPGPAPEAVRRFSALAQTPFVQACRYALGDEVDIGSEHALFCAAARIRFPDADDARLLLAYGDMGADGAIAARYEWSARKWDHKPVTYHLRLQVLPAPQPFESPFIALRRHGFDKRYENYFSGSESTLLYAASIIPGSLEAFFANGALQIGFNIDWWEARWEDKAYLAVAMDRSVPITPSAVKMLALALGGKEPGQTGMAVDAFVSSLLEERTDVASVASEIRWVLLSFLGTGARYAKSLAAVARAHPAMPAAVVATLCTILDIGAAAPPKDTGALLVLLLELSLANSLALPPGALANIGRFSLTGKAKAAQKELLARAC
ncbi:MAG: DUF6493 family protein [Pseudomonadota bacterium]